jgi:mono/diheme cytochrome c family protein
LTAVLALIRPAGAQQPATTTHSTVKGVYTEAQATRGRDTFAGLCQSCHSPATHSGPVFMGRWGNRPLWELFKYVSENMPQMDPGSLAPDEYAQVVAYLLKLNGMPPGSTELRADSTVLRTIQFEAARQDR